MKTEEEIQALNNAIEHFNIPFTLMVYNFDDARKKPKFFLFKNSESWRNTPVLDYNQMNHYILGMGMAVEHIK
jgi:hypothetical protein